MDIMKEVKEENLSNINDTVIFKINLSFYKLKNILSIIAESPI